MNFEIKSEFSRKVGIIFLGKPLYLLEFYIRRYSRMSEKQRFFKFCN